MNVFVSERHVEHAPPYSLFDGGVQVPYFECPERIDRVRKSLARTSWARFSGPKDFGLAPILAVHDGGYIDFLRTAHQRWIAEGGELGPDRIAPIITPDTFVPRRASARPPRSFHGQLGYYSTDTNAPIVSGTFAACVDAAHCALSAADAVLQGDRAAFSMARPPGHHAGRDYSGGFCFLNNAAIAATWLGKSHRVAILDIDFHAGNGTQDIFYGSDAVLTVSIHGDPLDFYPSFMGHADECGVGAGEGFHLNLPLPPGTDDRQYLLALSTAIKKIQAFAPSALVVSAGMDILASDPLGAFKVTLPGISKIGAAIAQLKLPTVICMEGGYNHDALGEGFRVLGETFV